MRQATVMLHFVVQEAEDGSSVIAQNRAKTLIKDYVVAFVIKLSILCFLYFVALCLVVTLPEVVCYYPVLTVNYPVLPSKYLTGQLTGQ